MSGKARIDDPARLRDASIQTVGPDEVSRVRTDSADRDLRSNGSRPSALTVPTAIGLTEWQQGRKAEPTNHADARRMAVHGATCPLSST